MAEYIQFNEANCKNCYKCIRNCPVKSIRFGDDQANIISNECILCGRCFVVCPQNAKKVRNDVPAAKELIASGAPVYASIAPSFVANYGSVTLRSMDTALKKLGFAGAEETAMGAELVKKQYDAMLDEGRRSVIIASCCPTINMLIRKYYPGALPYLAPVVTPMRAHCMDIKRRHPDAKTVFIGPCISKKEEADGRASHVDCALTFEELTAWLAEENVTLCGLGKTAPSPVVSTIESFREQYEGHIYHKHCPAGTCKKLRTIRIDPALCRGCSKCTRVCTVSAICG